MSAVAIKLVQYLPVFAVWLVLVGAVLNRDRLLITIPLAVGAMTGVVGIVVGTLWTLIPVLLTWVWGLAWMVRDHRHDRA